MTWADGGDPDNAPKNYREFQVQIEEVGGTWNDNRDWDQTTNWTAITPGDGNYRCRRAPQTVGR